MGLDLWANPRGVAGTDEAGRGCLAGPVVAAAVILPLNFRNEVLNDSKKLTAAQRSNLYDILYREAISIGVGWATAEEIGRINILQASFTAMHRALDALQAPFYKIAVDGNRFKPYGQKDYECVVKGDGVVMEIAAASIIAKVYRDRWMQKLHQQHPEYGWGQNKGYPTALHREAIRTFGPTAEHRRGFRLLQGQLDFK